MDDRGFVMRRPRHEACSNADLRLTITIPESNLSCDAGLGDLSRQGLKAITDIELPSNAMVYMLVSVAALHISIPGTICWSKLQDDGRWASGVMFQKELTWETMGELFLNGVLSPNAIRSPQMPHSV